MVIKPTFGTNSVEQFKNVEAIRSMKVVANSNSTQRKMEHLHKERGSVNLVAFKALGKPELVAEAPVRHAVISDHGVRQREHLQKGTKTYMGTAGTHTERPFFISIHHHLIIISSTTPHYEYCTCSVSDAVLERKIHY